MLRVGARTNLCSILTLFIRLPCVFVNICQDLDPWVTAPLFEDECNAMDCIGAMVAGRPPFGGLDSDGSSGSSNLRDCPSPPRGRPGDGPLDQLCESWEEDQPTQTNASADVLASAAADAASAQEYAQAYDGLAEAVTQEEAPEAARVGELIAPPDLSASAPAKVTDIALPHATALSVRGEDAIVVSAPSSASCPTSAVPPPVPRKPSSVTAAFLVQEGGAASEPLALWDGSNDAASGSGDVADTRLPGTISSQDLLLDWLRREASEGDEEAQFHLAQLFSPPRFEMKPACRDCGQAFGVTRYRHHCRHCGGSFCHEHAWHEHPIPKLGLPAGQVRSVR